MGSYQLAALFHLLLAVLVSGYVLFWAIMGLSLGRRFETKEVLDHLDTVKASRWPHVIVPWRFRPRLPLVGWLLLAAIAVTGLVSGYLSPRVIGLTPLYAIKLLLFLGVAVCHVRIARNPTPAVGRLALVLLGLVLIVSVLMIR